MILQSVKGGNGELINLVPLTLPNPQGKRTVPNQIDTILVHALTYMARKKEVSMILIIVKETYNF